MESGLTVHVDNARVMRALRATWLACKPGPQTAGLMRAVGYYIRKQTDQHFRDEKGPQGAWKALKDATVARRRKGKRKDVGHKILQDTGTLKRSFHVDAKADEVTVGTPTFYGVFHQDGAPRANIVPRPFMYLEDSDYDRIESLGLNYLARFVR